MTMELESQKDAAEYELENAFRKWIGLRVAHEEMLDQWYEADKAHGKGEEKAND